MVPGPLYTQPSRYVVGIHSCGSSSYGILEPGGVTHAEDQRGYSVDRFQAMNRLRLHGGIGKGFTD
jgi:hypothetical protein